MPTSSDRFAISLPVDPLDRWRLHAWVAAASLLSAGGLAAVSAGAGRLFALLPLASGLACHRRLTSLAPLPDAAEWSPRSGWSLRTGTVVVPVTLCGGSWFGRTLALASFRPGSSGPAAEQGRVDTNAGAAGERRVVHTEDRRWLVPLRPPPGGGSPDWRRLRVLWRTRRAALVGNWSNC